MSFILGGTLFTVLAVVVIFVGLQRFNRPTCPSCGLSVDRDLDTCPYCGASMR